MSALELVVRTAHCEMPLDLFIAQKQQLPVLDLRQPLKRLPTALDGLNVDKHMAPDGPRLGILAFDEGPHAVASEDCCYPEIKGKEGGKPGLWAYSRASQAPDVFGPTNEPEAEAKATKRLKFTILWKQAEAIRSQQEPAVDTHIAPIVHICCRGHAPQQTQLDAAYFRGPQWQVCFEMWCQQILEGFRDIADSKP